MVPLICRIVFLCVGPMYAPNLFPFVANGRRGCFFCFVMRSDGMVSTSEQLSKLEFCSAVFKEALRLRTPAPLLMFHSMVRMFPFPPRL